MWMSCLAGARQSWAHPGEPHGHRAGDKGQIPAAKQFEV